MRKLCLVLWIALLYSSPGLFAQKHLADSLEQLLKQTLPDSTRAFNMVYYAMYLEPVDMNKAYQVYKDALNFSTKKNLPYAAGLALRYQATPYGQEGKKELQIQSLKQAAIYFEKATGTKALRELGNTYTDIGTWYRSYDQYDSAVQWQLKGIAILEKAGADMTIGYASLAAIYQQLKLSDKQKEYATKSLAAARQSNKPRSLYIGHIYYLHYLVEVEQFDLARKHLDSAALYFSPDYPFAFVSSFYLMSGIVFQQLKQPDSAILYYNKAYEHAKQNNVLWSMVEPKIQIGHIYHGQKKYKEAEAYTKEGLALAEKDSIKHFMQEAHGLLGAIYEETGRYKEAIDHVWKYVYLKDSVEAQDRKKFTLELEKKYETEKKDTQLKLQQATIQQKNTLNYVLIGSAVALLIISLLAYLYYRKKQQLQQQRINELEKEKQLTATEAVLKGEEQERTRLAKDLHDGLGGMLSGIKYSFTTMKGNMVMTPENQHAFERSMDMLDSSIQEMRRVAHNMMPEVLVKYGLDTALKDFCVDINTSGALKVNYQSIDMEQTTIDQTTAITLYRIAQELLNNAIKHAGATQAIVQLIRSGNTISLTVEDDGKGFDINTLGQSGGIGWSNIRNRVEFLRAKLDISSSPGKGCSVLVEVDIKA